MSTPEYGTSPEADTYWESFAEDRAHERANPTPAERRRRENDAQDAYERWLDSLGDAGYITPAHAAWIMAAGALSWVLIFAFVSERLTVAAGIVACLFAVVAGILTALDRPRACCPACESMALSNEDRAGIIAAHRDALDEWGAA